LGTEPKQYPLVGTMSLFIVRSDDENPQIAGIAPGDDEPEAGATVVERQQAVENPVLPQGTIENSPKRRTQQVGRISV
jgi:hypothetical protein